MLTDLKAKGNLSLTRTTKALLDYFNNINLHDTSANIPLGDVNTRIVPVFSFLLTSYSKLNWLEFYIGNGKLYVMKNIKDFIEAQINRTSIKYGKNFEFRPRQAIFDEKSKALIDFLKSVYFDEKNFSSWGHSPYYFNSAFSEDRKFKLSGSNMLKFFEIMKEGEFDASINGVKKNVKIIEGRPNFKLDINSIQGGIEISLDMEDDVYYGLDNTFRYFYHKNVIYKVDSNFASYVAPIMKCFSENHTPEILIPEKEAEVFFSNILPSIEKIATVKLDPSLTKSFYREILEKRVYFDKYGNGIKAKIVFKYGELEINPVDNPILKSIPSNEKILLRETAKENKLLSIFKRYGFEKSNDSYVQKNENKIYDFLKGALDEITDLSEVFYSDEFKKISIKNSSKISAGVHVNTQSGLLEMNLQYEDIEPKELMDLLSSYKHKKRYHRLKGGQFISLDSAEFQSTVELIDQLNLSESNIIKKVFELPKYRAMYIDSIAREKECIHIERSNAFKKIVKDISEPQDMEFEIPEGICGKLRDYQKTGFKWLKTLSYYGFGGILADDMGLGKTLQIITLIKSDNQTDKKPSLVIVPTSLIYNWQEEVKKFAPDLSVTIISGTQSDRRKRFNDIKTSDIVVTSYGMIKNDIDQYNDYRFKYCFIDEAQHIKNPNTLNAKTVKQIKANAYFALTGTPIENTLTEIWSIFDFIMPGYLLSHNKFKNKFETPIVKYGDRDALKELGRHIKPFILRRMKKEVLKELPEKIESKMINEMTANQKKIYLAYFMKAKQEFEKEIAQNSFENSRIKIIAILTRLRQICCHPSLFIENYKDGSGKLEMLIELLEDAIDSGHRILVFSQFTSMLALIRNELDSMKVNYYYLDGSISAEERINLVNSFNGGKNNVFLISLKAGGTGLNLTGADMVVHFDPWWNPAVEDQATDRAYRIGQKNAVQVFKLITKDTIEEKIFELQQKKKELIDSVIKPGENFLTKMTEEEIRKLFET